VRILPAIQMSVAIGLMAGCSSSRPEGGGTYVSTYSEAHPQPVASPSQRPGLNPDDPRDAQFNSWPNPPTSKP
jgi:hypothetical protein